MNLINLKLPERKKDEKLEEAVPDTMEREEYPYGLKLRFEKEQVDKISSLQKIAAGAKVTISATGKVTEVRVTDSAKNSGRHSVEIQVQEVQIADQGSGRVAFKEATEK